MAQIDDVAADEVREAFDKLAESYHDLKGLLRQYLPNSKYQYIKSYAFGHIEPSLFRDGGDYLAEHNSLEEMVEWIENNVDEGEADEADETDEESGAGP